MRAISEKEITAMRKVKTISLLLACAAAACAMSACSTAGNGTDTSSAAESTAVSTAASDEQSADESVAESIAESTVESAAGSETESADASEDGQNPVMNFVGPYMAGRASLNVECSGSDGASFTIHWGSSATISTEWTMSGTFDSETNSVSYTDCKKKTTVYTSEGELESEDVEYENGTGTMHFNEDYTITWQDDMENAGEGLVFEFYTD